MKKERKMYALTKKYLESTLKLSTAGWAALILLFQLVTAIPTNSSHAYMAEICKWHLFFVDRPHTENFGPPFLSQIPNHQVIQIGQALPHTCPYLLYIQYS